MVKLINKKYLRDRYKKIATAASDINPNDCHAEKPSKPLRDYLNGILFLRSVSQDTGKNRITSRTASRRAKALDKMFTKDAQHIFNGCASGKNTVDDLIERFEMTPRSMAQIAVNVRRWKMPKAKVA
ncbi:MAG TPA: hypothetical protein VIN59_01270 [Alphaproteobacteria bacterium]